MQVTTTPENFKKAFKPYLVRWSIVYGIFMGFVTMLPVYFRWAGHDSELTYGPLTFGFNFVDIIAIGYNTAGIVAIGYNLSVLSLLDVTLPVLLPLEVILWVLLPLGITLLEFSRSVIAKEAKANTYSHRTAKMLRQYPSLHGGSPS